MTKMFSHRFCFLLVVMGGFSALVMLFSFEEVGGNTVIGKGAVIGGNVWLIHSVPAGAKVYNKQPSPEIK